VKQKALITLDENIVDSMIREMRMLFHNMLMAHLHMYDEHTYLKSEALNEKSSKKFYMPGKISYHDENNKISWDIIRRFMPQDIEEFLQKEYVLLSKSEVRLCCLLFCKVSNQNIAKILPYNQNSIAVTTFRIKQKTGITDIKEIYKKITVKYLLTKQKV
jgi:hypothetical protein